MKYSQHYSYSYSDCVPPVPPHVPPPSLALSPSVGAPLRWWHPQANRRDPLPVCRLCLTDDICSVDAVSQWGARPFPPRMPRGPKRCTVPDGPGRTPNPASSRPYGGPPDAS